MLKYLVGSPITTLINLSDNLPPEGCVVLVHGLYTLPEESRTEDIPEEYWTGKFYELAIRTKDGWALVYENKRIDEDKAMITHWMPMPKAISY